MVRRNSYRNRNPVPLYRRKYRHERVAPDSPPERRSRADSARIRSAFRRDRRTRSRTSPRRTRSPATTASTPCPPSYRSSPDTMRHSSRRSRRAPRRPTPTRYRDTPRRSCTPCGSRRHTRTERPSRTRACMAPHSEEVGQGMGTMTRHTRPVGSGESADSSSLVRCPLDRAADDLEDRRIAEAVGVVAERRIEHAAAVDLVRPRDRVEPDLVLVRVRRR